VVRSILEGAGLAVRAVPLGVDEVGEPANLALDGLDTVSLG